MSFNIELWNRCQKCCNLEKSIFYHKGQLAYINKCKYGYSAEIKCNKFNPISIKEDKENY